MNDASRPQLQGFLSRTANTFGEYRFTADRNDALSVTVNDCDGSPFDLVSSVRLVLTQSYAMY